MKKYVVLFCLVAMLALSGSALAAGTDAKDFSTEQDMAARWMDTMLVKNKPVEARVMMGALAQKSVTQDQMAKLGAEITKNLGSCNAGRFVSWTRFDQADQMVYLMGFEKEPAIYCVLVFSKQGELENFFLKPIPKENTNSKTDKK